MADRSRTLALLPKFTGALSLIGSTYIFQDVVFHRTSAHRVYHRLVLGLSCSDMIASVVNILSTWPSPADTPNVMYAAGTTQTCTAQGFFNELGNMATPLYNASLCLYYVLVINKTWSEERIKSRAEPFLHLIPMTVALTISILGLPFKLYNNSGWLCWFASYPKGCSQEDGTCTRGEHANTFRWVHYAIIWSSILYVTWGMYSIYLEVRKLEKEDSRERGNPDARRRGEKSKKIMIQSALFVGSLYLTWLFTTITRIYNIATGENNFALLVLMAIFFPLQGFFNCLVYLRPRYLRSLSRNKDASWKHLLWLTLHHESHPCHGLRQPNQPPTLSQRRADLRGSTADYYSMGNSKFSRYINSTQRLVPDDKDDINTVGAIAPASEYTPEARAAAKREAELQEKELMLKSVEERGSADQRESYLLNEAPESFEAPLDAVGDEFVDDPAADDDVEIVEKRNSIDDDKEENNV